MRRSDEFGYQHNFSSKCRVLHGRQNKVEFIDHFYRVPKSALKYTASKRIKELATPSRRSSERDLVYLDEEGNPSVIKPISQAAKHAVCSPRLAELAKPLRKTEKWNESIEDDIWRVSSSALRAVATPRITKLAQPKELPREYYELHESTRTQSPKFPSRISSRIDKLATPHRRISDEFFIDMEYAMREKLRKAGLYQPTANDEMRSRPIPFADGFIPHKTDSELLIVSPTALEYEVTDRINQLAKPKPRSLDVWEQEYNPLAYVVSRAAQVAIPSERIKQLSQPVSRYVNTEPN